MSLLRLRLALLSDFFSSVLLAAAPVLILRRLVLDAPLLRELPLLVFVRLEPLPALRRLEALPDLLRLLLIGLLPLFPGEGPLVLVFPPTGAEADDLPGETPDLDGVPTGCGRAIFDGLCCLPFDDEACFTDNMVSFALRCICLKGVP